MKENAVADLYDTDVVVWADRQSALLRRLAAGERVNADIDWDNVVEEVQSVGRSQIDAVRSLLTRAIEYLLKVRGWSAGPAAHWTCEARTFLLDAGARFTPSMVSRLDLDSIYFRARATVCGTLIDGQPPVALPEACPFQLRQLLPPGARAIPDIEGLLAAIVAEPEA